MESAMTLKVRAEMAQTPAARPSRPSMKFTMLMIAATQMHGEDDREPLRQVVDHVP